MPWPLWPYIADFYCAKLLLVIEIDGNIHENNKLYDEARENRMRELCIETIRYTNSTVLTNLEEVEQDILKKLSERNKFFS